MSLSPSNTRPLVCLRQALRQCRAERLQQRRKYAVEATTTGSAAPPPPPPGGPAGGQVLYPSLQPRYPAPSKGFRPSQATKQNRFETGIMKKIRVLPPPPAVKHTCPDPISTITSTQLTTLDPNGARTRLFGPSNPDRAKVGDILLVRLKSGDPFSGVVLNIRQTHSVIDTAILLRNQLTRVGVEMWFKVYSPNVEAVEVVQRRVRRARRAKLYYMRQARHDQGSVEGIVRTYMRSRAGGPTNARSQAAGMKQKKQKKGGAKGKANK